MLIFVACVINPGLAVKSYQTPRAWSVQFPLVGNRHVIPAGKRIGNPRSAHRIHYIAFWAQDGRAQRLMVGLLNALSEPSMVLDRDPALFVEDVR